MWLLTLTTQEAEIKRIVIQGQPWQKVHKTSSQSIKDGHVSMHLATPASQEA
jgi:hypothetical protein